MYRCTGQARARCHSIRPHSAASSQCHSNFAVPRHGLLAIGWLSNCGMDQHVPNGVDIGVRGHPMRGHPGHAGNGLRAVHGMRCALTADCAHCRRVCVGENQEICAIFFCPILSIILLAITHNLANNHRCLSHLNPGRSGSFSSSCPSSSCCR